MDQNAAIHALDVTNDFVSKLIPLVPNIMGLLQLFIRKPDADPVLRQQAIQTLRANGVTLEVESAQWLTDNGYDEQGNKLP